MKSSKKKCETTEDCGEFTSLCCDVAGKKECRNGIHIIPKEGGVQGGTKHPLIPINTDRRCFLSIEITVNNGVDV